jgi:hypothetical protein
LHAQVNLVDDQTVRHDDNLRFTIGHLRVTNRGIE